MNRFVSLLIFIIVLVVLWTGGWIFAANTIKSQTNDYFAQSQLTEQKVNCGNIDVAGFPFRFDVTCSDLTISNLDLLLTLPELKASLLVYRPTHLLAFAQGPLTIQDSFSGSKRELTWDHLAASVRTNGWALTRASFEADNLQLFDNLIAHTLIAGSQRLEAHLLDSQPNVDAPPNHLQYVALAKLENAAAPEFAIQNAALNFEATLSSMPDDLRQWSAQNIAKIWFDTQTGIEVHTLTAQDQISSFSINGQVTTTAQAMLSGNFDFFTNEMAPRFAPFMEPNGVQVVFGSKSEDQSHYQSYSLVHGVLLAGNLPILTFSPMR